MEYQPKLNIFVAELKCSLTKNRFMKKTFQLLIFIFALCFQSCNTVVSNNNEIVYVQIKTNLGDIKVKLYNETPIHRDNFIKLVNSGFYEGVTFHRVIKDFMIQAGNPATKPNANTLPDSLNTYTIPAEFNSAFFHKKGALAAARQGNDINPYMRSSGTQFYIVQGAKLTEEELNFFEQQISSQIKQAQYRIILKEMADSLRASGITPTDAEIQDASVDRMFQLLTASTIFQLSPEQREAYMTIGGTPRLDGTYTVFGEVIEGLEIVDKIADTDTDSADKPLSNITILKMLIEKK